MDFANLYGTYAREVFRFSLFLCGNRAIAEDLTAETFARALSLKHDLRVDTVKAYLFAIARNLHRDLLRRERRLVPLADTVHDRADPRPDPDAAARGREALEDVLEAIQRLPEGEREALVLAIDQELTHERIAAILGCSASAVKVRIHRARLRLRALLGPREEEEPQ
jgi:RNA polymerase sigma-70 factor (ECF subfamily)